MKPLKIRDQVFKFGEVCDHCLGRQVYGLFKQHLPEQTGAALRTAKKEADVKKSLKKKLKIYETEKCSICKGIFLRIDKLFPALLGKANEAEFNTFQIGCSIDPGVMAAEEKLWSKIGMEYCMPIKKEINNLLAKKLAAVTKKKPVLEIPDITFTVDFRAGKAHIQINQLFIYGRYRKLKRDIPQSKWHCNACGGRGCKRCNFSGHEFPETVESLIAEPALEAAQAREEKFHAAGREDKEARMLGKGRPFVLEVIRPKRRNLKLKDLEKEINKRAKGKVEVSGLRLSDKKEVRLIKTQMFDKSYECLVECKAVTAEDLKKLNKSFNNVTLSQKTPSRVLKTRADKTRKRKVISVKCKKKTRDKLITKIKAEAGTYVKELISGDDGRTVPSFAAVIGKPCKCLELDVIEIHGLEK
jgi:tRNA pseudouridine synthase 10